MVQVTMEKPSLFRLLYQLLRCQRKYSMTPSPQELPRITVPQKMAREIAKAKERHHVASRTKRPSLYKSRLVISCKRDQYNHHQGQTYSEFDPSVLASHGWKHKGSAGDHFTLVSYAENPSLMEENRQCLFTDFDLHNGLKTGLEHLGLTRPTLIQRLAIPKILEGNNVMCAAETGSGKTLAYLLPALQHVHAQQLTHPGVLPPNSPRTIILTPSRELADQILEVCKRLSDHAEFVPHGLCGGRGTKHRLAWRERASMDVLVSTPGVLRKFLNAGQLHPRFLQHVILDEADSLLDDSFSSEVNYVLSQLKVTGGRGQIGTVKQGGTLFTLVSATMPRSLEQTIGNAVPMDSLMKVTTNHLHHLMPHIPQTFMRLKPSQKAETLLQLVHKNHQQRVPTLIFCNKSSTCFWLTELLRENSIPSGLMNGEIQEKRRSSLYGKFQNGQIDIMVATDIASRGLDLLRVSHVINFDFPHFISDYIHRVGRVGRVGSHSMGKVTSFITHKWDVDLLWQIETAARKDQALHNVNANIKRKIDGIVARKFPHRRQ